MTVDIRIAEPDDLETLVTFDYRNFGAIVEDGDVDETRAELDLDRFLLAWHGDRLVGAAGSYEMELTLPGPVSIPMSGVTWVSVAASHRRQGLAARLMAGLDDLATGFGDPILGLTASEGGIYERFGYGISTRTRVVEIDRSRAAVHQRWQPEAVDLIIAQDHLPELFERYDRFRRIRVGEVSRPEALYRGLTMSPKKPAFAALHADGHAIYGIEPKWNDGQPAHQLNLTELVATTPEAHLALWNLLLSVDLVGTVRSIRAMAIDDPLPHLLTDQRAVRTVALNDGLWLKVTDPARCFGARTYRTDDRLVVGVVESVDDLASGAAPTEMVAVGAGGGQLVDEQPDLITCRAGLGPLLVGASATEQARNRRLRASPEVLDRADALFGIGVAAHCCTGF